MDNDSTFGAFLREKRKSREIPLRTMAERLDIAAGYYSDIETGRRSPIDLELLDKMIAELSLSAEDRETFYDLAGRARSAAPPDLTGYINETKAARIALRVAKEKASTEDWLRFVRELENKE